MNNNKLTLGLLLVLVIAVLGLYFPQSQALLSGISNFDQVDTGDGFSVDGTSVINGSGQVVAPVNSSNTLTVDAESNLANLVYGDADGSIPSITTTAPTLTAAQVCDNSVIDIAGPVTTSTITLPHSTSTVADCLTANGDVRNLVIRNASSSSQTATVASSTGITFLKPFTGSSTFTLIGGEAALLKFIRLTSTTLLVTFQRMF